MQLLEVSGAVRHIYIYIYICVCVIRRLRVNNKMVLIMSALAGFSCELLVYFSDLHRSEKLQL